MKFIPRLFRFIPQTIRVSWLSISKGYLKSIMIQYTSHMPDGSKINLCSGTIKVPGYCSIDLVLSADLILDLSKVKLPFKNGSIDAAICISGINYFSRLQGEKLVNETYRVLKLGGIARFAVQDLKSLTRKYVEEDYDFFFQKLPNGKERFDGSTLGDKFVSWFYGYPTAGGPCKYFYDYESLAYIFHDAGFSIVEQKSYLESRLSEIDKIDNRPDQMFFLEAVK
jgi:predicted SAM-dependent methyltransferase